MIKEIRNLVAFLTIIPVGMDQGCLTDAARYMFLFPLVGALIGSLAGMFAWLLLQVIPNQIVGILTLGLILLVTGLHHTDGLLDFGDGIMCHGSPEMKIEVMLDEHTGAGGLATGLITLLTTAFCIAELKADIIIKSLVVSEALAKFSMVVGAWVGRSAHLGMNTYFIDAMHGRHRKIRLIVAFITSFGISTGLLGVTGFITLIAGTVASLVIVWVSNRHFRGVTGDVLGAMNDFARMVSLITVLVAVRWV